MASEVCKASKSLWARPVWPWAGNRQQLRSPPSRPNPPSDPHRAGISTHGGEGEGGSSTSHGLGLAPGRRLEIKPQHVSADAIVTWVVMGLGMLRCARQDRGVGTDDEAFRSSCHRDIEVRASRSEASRITDTSASRPLSSNVLPTARFGSGRPRSRFCSRDRTADL